MSENNAILTIDHKEITLPVKPGEADISPVITYDFDTDAIVVKVSLDNINSHDDIRTSLNRIGMSLHAEYRRKQMRKMDYIDD